MSAKKLTTVAYDALTAHSVMGNVLKLVGELPEKQYMDELKRHLRPLGGLWKGGDVSGFVFKDQGETYIREQVKAVLDLGYETIQEQMDRKDLTCIILPVDELNFVLNKVGEVISAKPLLPVLANVLLKIKGGRVIVIGTDLIVTVIGDIVFSGGHDETNFSCLVPYKVLSDFIKSIDEKEVKFAFYNPGATWSTESDKLIFETLDEAKDFPDLPAFPEENSLKINDNLVHWLKMAQLTVAKESMRDAMKRICMRISPDKLTIASTNASCLFEKGFMLPEDSEMGLPVRNVELLVTESVVSVLKGYNEVTICWNSSHVGFVAGNITVTCKLGDDVFPQYEEIFPKASHNITFHRESLMHVMEMMNIMGVSYAELYLKREEGYVFFEALDTENARKVTKKMLLPIINDEQVKYTGNVDRVMLNPKQLLPLLKQQECTDIQMAIVNATTAALLLDADDHLYRALIMPMYHG